MKKTFNAFACAWAICLAVFNVVCFAIPESVNPGKFEGSFWIGYIFVTLAFLVELFCAYKAFSEDNAQKFFYSVPLIRISYIGVILTVIFGSVCMVLPFVPSWVAAIVCVIVAAFVAVALVKASAAAQLAEETDRKVASATSFVKSLTAEAGNLSARAKTPEANAACTKVFEALRYSDPVSSDALAGEEAKIAEKFTAFSVAVTGGADGVGDLADELVTLIGDRNRKCKAMK